MILNGLKIRCINLDRSPERWVWIQKAFDGYDVKRIEAIDGRGYSDGTFDYLSRPRWDDKKLDGLIADGLIERGFMHYNYHYPSEFAGGQSCVKALGDFLSTGEEWSVIIEDDVEPVGDLHAIEIPDSADFFSLVGSDNRARVTVQDDGQIAWLRTFGAYVISRRAAEIMMHAMTPSYYLVDMQVPIRCFESMADTYQTRCPPWPALERFEAYAPKKSIVRLSRFSEQSTFTGNGKKTWLGDRDD